jgi:hypothetical protein
LNRAANAHDALLEIAVAEPCLVGAPLLHRLVDGELSVARTREAAEHAQRCPSCRDHLRWLELEEQAVREIAAPTPRRFVALWSERLREKLVTAITEEAGFELVRAAERSAGGERGAIWARSRDYLRQLASWQGRTKPRAPRRADAASILARFALLMGDEWSPLAAARAILSAAPRR